MEGRQETGKYWNSNQQEVKQGGKKSERRKMKNVKSVELITERERGIKERKKRISRNVINR